MITQNNHVNIFESSDYPRTDIDDLLNDDSSVSDYESDSDSSSSESTSSEEEEEISERRTFLHRRLRELKQMSSNSKECTGDEVRFETDSLKLSKRRVVQTDRSRESYVETDDDSSIESYEDIDVPLQRRLKDLNLSFPPKAKMQEFESPIGGTIAFRKNSLSSRAA